jgi:hypothetical protein
MRGEGGVVSFWQRFTTTKCKLATETGGYEWGGGRGGGEGGGGMKRIENIKLRSFVMFLPIDNRNRLLKTSSRLYF